MKFTRLPIRALFTAAMVGMFLLPSCVGQKSFVKKVELGWDKPQTLTVSNSVGVITCQSDFSWGNVRHNNGAYVEWHKPKQGGAVVRIYDSKNMIWSSYVIALRKQGGDTLYYEGRPADFVPELAIEQVYLGEFACQIIRKTGEGVPSRGQDVPQKMVDLAKKLGNGN